MKRSEWPSYQNSLRLSREAKQRKTGTCETCGATTRYSGHGRAVSSSCVACATKRIGLAKRGHGPAVERILSYLDQPRRFMEIVNECEISTANLGSRLDRLRKYGLVQRLSRGVYVRADVDV